MKPLEQLLAQITALESENASLKAQLAQHGPGPAGGVSVADVAALTTERDALKAEVGTLRAANDTLAREVNTLKAAQADFDGKVAMQVAQGLVKHGIRTEGVGTNHKANGSADELNNLVKRANARAKNHMPSQP